MKFKNSRTALSRVSVAVGNLLCTLRSDLSSFRPKAQGSPERLASSDIPASEERPVIFASYATGPDLNGSHRYCGGEKLLNNLVLLLRRQGYEAFMVSIDGKNAGWLTEHAPFLSLGEFRNRLAGNGPVRCVTSWPTADAFLTHCPKFYFWDQELAASARGQFPVLAHLMRNGRIVRTAGVNRAVQAFHHAVFERQTVLLRQLVDEKYWQPNEPRRIKNRVGYFDEGGHTSEFIRVVRDQTAAQGHRLEFVELRGDEPQIIEQMQQCAVFLALNTGKSPLWGEGGPMSPQESMACGTVPVCFDINGPWELIQQNYNGVILNEFTPAALSEAVQEIFRVPERLEEMSQRCLEMTRASHTMEARWPAVRRFLDLPE